MTQQLEAVALLAEVIGVLSTRPQGEKPYLVPGLRNVLLQVQDMADVADALDAIDAEDCTALPSLPGPLGERCFDQQANNFRVGPPRFTAADLG